MMSILNFRIVAQNGKTQFYCATIAYHVVLCAFSEAAGLQPTINKNNRLDLAQSAI